MKLKNLKPSMRENKRYLLIQSGVSKESMEKKLLDFLGTLGYSQLGLAWIEKKGNKAVLAVNREAVNHVKAAFTLSKEKVEVVKVSGTLKGLRK